jgi:putative ABC transport system substrate-binding protein
MIRRAFIAGLGGAVAWPMVVRGQQRSIPVIGFLFAGTLALRPQAQEFWRALNESGYIEGKTVLIEVREAQGEMERLPRLADELVKLRPDVLVAVTNFAVEAARKATQDIPIVMAIVADPLGFGFVKNPARPEGNITGPSWTVSHEIWGKQMQLLKEMLPERSIIGILWNAESSSTAPLIPYIEQAGRSVGASTISLPFEGPANLEAGLARGLAAHVNAIFVMPNPVTFDHRRKIIEFSLANRIPTFHGFPDEVADGALAAYGASLKQEYRRAAHYVVKILNGAAPADLPVEQATQFSFAINLKTAKALGLDVPKSLLARADEVIE